jgi:hypothetical protein
MKNLESYSKILFDEIKHIDENNKEYWFARELYVVLNYKKWQKFEIVIRKSIIACKNSEIDTKEQFTQVGKLSKRGNNTVIEIKDYKLSRYACYLIVQNSDSRKKVVALGQTYFAIQTRKQELLEDEYVELSETEKRFYNRNIIKKGNFQLNNIAKKSGVKNFDKFHNAGYKGLYNGETANDIAKRKNLRYREDILDNMGSDELAANIFRISQAKQKLINENIQGEINANITHYEVGKKVRQTIKEIGGTVPERLQTPNKSLKELNKLNKNTNITSKL